MNEVWGEKARRAEQKVLNGKQTPTYESVWCWIKNTRRPQSFRNMFDFVQPTKTQRRIESVKCCRQSRRDNAKWKSSEVMQSRAGDKVRKRNTLLCTWYVKNQEEGCSLNVEFRVRAVQYNHLIRDSKCLTLACFLTRPGYKVDPSRLRYRRTKSLTVYTIVFSKILQGNLKWCLT